MYGWIIVAIIGGTLVYFNGKNNKDECWSEDKEDSELFCNHDLASRVSNRRGGKVIPTQMDIGVFDGN